MGDVHTSGRVSPWMTYQEAASYCHVSLRTLTRWVATRKLASSCIGQVARVHQDDIDQLFRTNRRARPGK